MYQKSVRALKGFSMDIITFFLLLAGLVIVWLPFQNLLTSPKKTIQKAIQNTKYKHLENYVIAQARHESANFTSDLFLKNLNAFGMSVPYARTRVGEPSQLIVEGNKMQKYSSLGQSVQDLVLWLDYNNFPIFVESPQDYAAKLKEKGYYTDSVKNYSKALERWMTIK